MSIIFSIEGNIGSGKSTLVEELKKRNLNTDKKIIYLREPVNEWNQFKDENGETILSKFYRNQNKYSFPFQLMAYISRISQIRKTIEKNPTAIIICERCVLTDKNVFAQMLYDMDKIEKICFDIYLKWFDEFRQKISGFIYIRTKPETSLNRVKNRKRKGEESVSFEYLQLCNKYHEKWLNTKKNILILDGDKDKEKHNDLFNTWALQIEEFLKEQFQKNSNFTVVPNLLNSFINGDYPIFM